MMAFAIGFLLTALPRRTQTQPVARMEMVALLAALVIFACAAIGEHWVIAETAYAALFALLIEFALRRFLKGGVGRRRPAAFMLLPIAALNGMGGGRRAFSLISARRTESLCLFAEAGRRAVAREGAVGDRQRAVVVNAAAVSRTAIGNRQVIQGERSAQVHQQHLVRVGAVDRNCEQRSALECSSAIRARVENFV